MQTGAVAQWVETLLQKRIKRGLHRRSAPRILPFDIFHRVLQNALRPFAAGKARRGAMEHIEAQRTTQRETPAFMIEVDGAVAFYDRLAADDAGLGAGLSPQAWLRAVAPVSSGTGGIG
jgi:hypothetical protein